MNAIHQPLQMTRFDPDFFRKHVRRSWRAAMNECLLQRRPLCVFG